MSKHLNCAKIVAIYTNNCAVETRVMSPLRQINRPLTNRLHSPPNKTPSKGQKRAIKKLRG